MTAAAIAATVNDTHPSRWRMLSLLAGAELLGMSLWFAATAVGGQLAQRLGVTANQAVWLTSTVQLGFVFGTATAALLNLADILPPFRRSDDRNRYIEALRMAGLPE